MERDYGRICAPPPDFDAGYLGGKNGRARYNKRCKVWAKTGGLCTYCHGDLVFYGASAFHADHVIPKSRGGSNGVGNLTPSCQFCNLSKGPKTPKEWKEVCFGAHPNH